MNNNSLYENSKKPLYENSKKPATKSNNIIIYISLFFIALIIIYIARSAIIKNWKFWTKSWWVNKKDPKISVSEIIKDARFMKGTSNYTSTAEDTKGFEPVVTFKVIDDAFAVKKLKVSRKVGTDIKDSKEKVADEITKDEDIEMVFRPNDGENMIAEHVFVYEYQDYENDSWKPFKEGTKNVEQTLVIGTDQISVKTVKSAEVVDDTIGSSNVTSEVETKKKYITATLVNLPSQNSFFNPDKKYYLSPDINIPENFNIYEESSGNSTKLIDDKLKLHEVGQDGANHYFFKKVGSSEDNLEVLKKSSDSFTYSIVSLNDPVNMEENINNSLVSIIYTSDT